MVMIWGKNTPGRGAARVKDLRRKASQDDSEGSGLSQGKDVVAIYRDRNTWKE